MFCPLTGKPCNKPKNIHVSEVVNGEPSHLHICQECAPNLENITGGMAIEPPQQMTSLPLILGTPGPTALTPLAILAGIMNGFTQPSAIANKESEHACPQCGTTLRQIAEQCRLGCSHCYVEFQKNLEPLLDKCHEGKTRHVGKRPKSRSKHDAIKLLENNVTALEARMAKAVNKEDYETAALLRDQIRMLRKKMDFHKEV